MYRRGRSWNERRAQQADAKNRRGCDQITGGRLGEAGLERFTRIARATVTGLRTVIIHATGRDQREARGFEAAVQQRWQPEGQQQESGETARELHAAKEQ